MKKNIRAQNRRRKQDFLRSSQGPVVLATFVFLALCLLMGGASRIGDQPLVVLRPAAVLLLGLGLMFGSRQGLRIVAWPLALLGCLAASMLIQLVPLPPGLWRTLPMSGLYAPVLEQVGLAGRWRPISIVPDYTVNALIALLPPAAVLVGLGRFGARGHAILNAALVGAAAASAALGLAQITGGRDSALYLWAVRSEAVADGVFANRNHQAVFLACALAMLGSWIMAPLFDETRQSVSSFRRRLGAGFAAALFLLVGTVATGSRTGMVLALAGAAFSYVQIVASPQVRRIAGQLPRWVRRALRWGWVALPVLAGIVVLAGRAISFNRFAGTDVLDDQRVRSLPVILDMAAALFPWGSGHGTFDPAYRAFEPDRLLQPAYMNHAHNDWLELVLVGGLPAVIVIVLALGLLAVGLLRAYRAPLSPGTLRARGAGVAIVLIALASVVDYPARTPLVACLLAILAVWLMHSEVKAGPRTLGPQSDAATI